METLNHCSENISSDNAKMNNLVKKEKEKKKRTKKMYDEKKREKREQKKREKEIEKEKNGIWLLLPCLLLLGTFLVLQLFFSLFRYTKIFIF